MVFNSKYTVQRFIGYIKVNVLKITDFFMSQISTLFEKQNTKGDIFRKATLVISEKTPLLFHWDFILFL